MYIRVRRLRLISPRLPSHMQWAWEHRAPSAPSYEALQTKTTQLRTLTFLEWPRLKLWPISCITAPRAGSPFFSRRTTTRQPGGSPMKPTQPCEGKGSVVGRAGERRAGQGAVDRS